jgi:hypothetical protein
MKMEERLISITAERNVINGEQRNFAVPHDDEVTTIKCHGKLKCLESVEISLNFIMRADASPKFITTDEI